MSDILKNNPTVLRGCIYYEFLREKNVEEAYKNFCKTVGDGVIEYVDFEYWFYRFYHGNLDVDHDRSADPISLILTDLPMEMLNEIVGKLDIQNRFTVRKVSKRFENIVDRLKSEYDDISIYIEKQEVVLYVKSSNVSYEKGKTDYFRSYTETNKNQEVNSQLSALSAVLTNSKSPIDYFCIYTLCSETIDTDPKFIESLSKEVCPMFYAKRVWLDLQHNDYIIQLLSMFKPGVLEHLVLNLFKCDDDTFARVVEMDQFKQIKSFDSREKFSLSEIKKLSHLSAFEVRIDRVSSEEIIILRDIVSQFANLKSVNILLYNPMNLSEIGTVLGSEYDNSGQIICRHPIPNYDKSLILNIEIRNISVTIEND